MDTMDAECQICGRQIRIAKGGPALCRICTSPQQDQIAKGWYIHNGTRIIVPGRRSVERKTIGSKK